MSALTDKPLSRFLEDLHTIAVQRHVDAAESIVNSALPDAILRCAKREGLRWAAAGWIRKHCELRVMRVRYMTQYSVVVDGEVKAHVTLDVLGNVVT